MIILGVILAGVGFGWWIGPRFAVGVAVALFALVPVKWLPLPVDLTTLSPPLLVLSGSLAHRALLHRSPMRLPPPWPLLACLLIFLSVLMSPNRLVSAGWALSFVAALLLPFFLTEDRSSAAALRAVWTALGAFIGVYATIETALLQANPLLDWAYRGVASPEQIEGTWSVYRATTTMGHPLVNAAFLAAAAPLAIAVLIERPTRWRWLALAAILSGVIATASRGGFVAAVFGVLVTLWIFRSQATMAHRSTMRTVAAAIGVPILLVAVVFIGARSSSLEGAASSSFRARALQMGLEVVADVPVFGVGAGLAADRSAHDAASTSIAMTVFPLSSFENAWLELAIALGVPGAMLLAAALVGGFRAASQAGPLGASFAGAVVAYSVSLGSFNLLEGHRPSHVLFGALLAGSYACGVAPSLGRSLERTREAQK